MGKKSLLALFGRVLLSLRLCCWRNLTPANETCCLCLRVHTESVQREGNSSVTLSLHCTGRAGAANLDLTAVSRCARQTEPRPDQGNLSITEGQLKKHGRGFAACQVFLTGTEYLEHLNQNKQTRHTKTNISHVNVQSPYDSTCKAKPLAGTEHLNWGWTGDRGHER